MANRTSLRTFAPSRASVTSTIADAHLDDDKGPDSYNLIQEEELPEEDAVEPDETPVRLSTPSRNTSKSRKSTAAEQEVRAETGKSMSIDVDTELDHEFTDDVDPAAAIVDGEAVELTQEIPESGFDPAKTDHVMGYYHRKSDHLHATTSQTDIALLVLKVNPDEESQYGHFTERVISQAHSPDGIESKMTDLYHLDYRGSSYMNLKSYVTVFEALALSTVLEELYLQLELLGHSFPGQYLQSEDADFLTYDERFTLDVSPAELIYMPKLKHFKNPFIIDETQIGTKEERLAHKMQKDRAFLQEIIRLVKDEIDQHRTFEKLKDNVSREDGRRHEEITLMEREKKAKQNVMYLRKRINDFREQMARDEHNRKEMINHLKDQVFQEKQNSQMDARYTRATLEARNTFNYSELNHLAELEQLKTKELEIQMTRDRLAHKNIEAWSALMFLEIEGRTNDWQEKFDKDLEMIDKRIHDKQDVLRTQLSMIEGLNHTIEDRMVELGPWEEEKEQERQARIANLRLYYSARKIQRWWRAFMVKHNLYKKRKGKKGKGKGKGKGKKGGGKRKAAKPKPGEKGKPKKKGTK